MENKREQKTDRRILRTEKAIKEAFFTLLETKPVNKIHVRELCDLANINRTSFYDHYFDYQDFLDSMETEIANDMLEQFDDLFAREDYAKVTMRRFLHLVKTKRETKLLFSEGSTHKAVQIFEAALKERALPEWLKNGTLTPTQADYLFCYIVRGGAAVIQQWYERGFQEPEKKIEVLLTTVITTGLYAFMQTKQTGLTKELPEGS